METIVKFFLIVCLITNFGCLIQKNSITQNKAIEIAKEKMVDKQLNPNAYMLNADSTVCNISELKARHRYFTLSADQFKEISKNVKNNLFWYIYFEPKKTSLGGDFHFFINAKNGKILYIISGE